MENILWNTWQYLVDVFDCFLILYLFRKMMRTRLRQPKYYYLFLPVSFPCWRRCCSPVIAGSPG